MNGDDELRAKVRAIGVKKVANKASINLPTLSTWLNRPDADMRGKNKTALVAAVRALDADQPDPMNHNGHTFYAVPVYDARAAAGAGSLVEDGEPVAHEMFRESWLRRIAPNRLPSLSIIEVSGDSMEETLRTGDRILVDRSVRRIVKEGIYIILYEGELLVKRCQRDLTDGSTIVRSDNTKYAEFRLKKGAQLDVVGMVLWVGRNIA